MRLAKWTLEPAAEGMRYDDVVGFLDRFIDLDDPRPAREQLDASYQHGGGWRPLAGFKLLEDGSIKYPGDPPHKPLACTKLREERIVLYDHAWVAIIQRNGSFEVARMD